MSECFMCAAGVPAKEMSYANLLTKVQVRFPRSKKVRIRKKWAKNPKNWSPVPVLTLLPFKTADMQDFLEKVKNAKVVSLDVETSGVGFGLQEAY